MASGFVESVNYTDGSMKLQNGPTVRINDPNGVVSCCYYVVVRLSRIRWC